MDGTDQGAKGSTVAAQSQRLARGKVSVETAQRYLHLHISLKHAIASSKG